MAFSAYAPLIVGGVVIVLCWIPWLAAAVGGVNVLDRKKPLNDLTTTIYFWLGVVVTIAAAAVGLKAWLRGLALMKRGVATQARIASIGSVARNGIQPVTFAYVVGGRQYTIARDVPCDFVDCYTRDTRLPLVYDPDNPAQAEITDMQPEGYIAPASIPAALKEGLVEGLIESFGNVILIVLLIANIVVAYAVARLFGAPSDLFKGTRGIPVLCAGIALTAIEITGWIVYRRQRSGGLHSIRGYATFAAIMVLVTIGAAYLYS